MEIQQFIEQMKSDVLGKLGGFTTDLSDIKSKFAALQTQVDAIDLRGNHFSGGDPGEPDPIESVLKTITEHPGFQSLRESGRGRLIVEPKTSLFEQKTITSAGIVPYVHETGIADSGRRMYGNVRLLMRSLPIETGSVQFIKETVFTDATSPQVEAQSKAESNFTFTAATAAVQTLAAWTSASKQVLDDLVELGEHIRTSLLYGLEKKFEAELLIGDGTGVHFAGLATTATVFDLTLLNIFDSSTGYTLADFLGAAILQLNEAGYGCSGIVLNPRDWFRVQAQKDLNHNYLLGSPQRELRQVLWSTPIVSSPVLSAGSFLAGDFDSGAHIRMRQASTIDISDSHDTFFTSNKIAIRAEQRAALVTTKPGAFVYGNLITTSPA
jgi:HK97 family phage major capsid protein